MREVKYQAWFVKEKRMAEVDSLVFIGNGHAEVSAKTDFAKGGWYTPLRECTNRKTVVDGSKEQVPRVILREYTGLKDKNGVEIFDKDIVEIKGHAFQGAMNIDGNYQVGHNEYMELCCGNLILFRQLPYVSVIGNIYEHPHLLEATQ